MIALFAETNVQVLGKEVTDPTLQLVSILAFFPLFIGMFALVVTSRMVDEERLRAEPSIAKLFGPGLPPWRVLTDFGRKVRMAAFAALGVGAVLMLYLVIRTR